MVEVLGSLQGRFILSINDVSAIRQIFAGYTVRAVGVTYTVSKGRSKRARELIIYGPKRG